MLASLHSCVSPSVVYARTEQSTAPPSPLPCATAFPRAPPPHLQPPPRNHYSTFVCSTSPTQSHQHLSCGKLHVVFAVAATATGAPPCSRSLWPCSTKPSHSLLSCVKDILESHLAHVIDRWPMPTCRHQNVAFHRHALAAVAPCARSSSPAPHPYPNLHSLALLGHRIDATSLT